jgi:type II secretory pathway pseudopilin PulG
MNAQRLLLLAVLAVLGLAFAAMAPELQRYLKIRSM